MAGALFEQAGCLSGRGTESRRGGLRQASTGPRSRSSARTIHLTPRLSLVLIKAEDQMRGLHDEFLSVEHVFLRWW